MNRIYKTVWSEQAGTFVAASEITRSRRKRSGRAVVAATVLAASMGLGGVAVAQVDSVTGAAGEIVVSPGTGNVTIGLDSAITDAIQDNTTAIGSKADQTALDAATSRITTNEDDIGALQSGKADQSDLTDAVGRITTNEGDISALQSGKADQSALEVATGRITTNEDNISTLQSGKADLSALEATDLKVNQLGGDAASLFGGGAAYDSATGTITRPTYTITTGAGGTQNVDNVGDALALMNGFDPSGGTVDATGIKYFHVRSQKADSQARGDDSTAIGPLARVDDSSAAGIAMGLGAEVNQNSENTIAIGTGAKSDPVENPAGSGTYDPAKDSVAIGTDATVTGSDAVAMGHGSSAGTGSVGIGQSASAHGGNAVGIGSDAVAVDGSSVALGHGAQALMNQDIAIGRQAGAGSSGTPNADTQNIYIGSQAGAGVSNGGRNIAMGVQAGQGRGNDSDQNIAIGVEAGINQTGRGNIAIGVGAARRVNTDPGVVETVAVGHEARTSDSYAVAVGSEAEAQGSNATAVGYNTVAAGGNSLALGANAQARYGKAVALGADSVADSVLDQIDQVAYLTGQSAEYSVSIGAAPDGGNSGFNRRISNVAGGFRDTDAVNVAQLRGAQQSVTQLIGGGVSVNPNGSYSQITIKDTDGVDHQFNTVVEAIGAVSSGTIDVSSPDAVMYADSSHSLITLDNDGTRITNVAEGTAPGDAVNKGQMDSAIDASRTHYYSVNSTDTPNRNNEGATGADAIAAGMHAEAKGDNSVAIGHDSKAGHSDTTGGLAGIAVGYTADVRDDYGIAMGVGSRSFADHASAIGHDARADGLSSVALGHNASVEVVSNPSADDGIAIGTNSHVIADQGTAIGKNAWAYAGQAQAFGNEAKADENATRGVALGDHATTGSVDSYAIGTQATGGAADGFAIGSDATTSGSSSYAIGHTAHSQGTNSFAVGTQAQTGNQAADSIAMGTESTVIGRESIAVGANNTIGQTDTDGDGNPILVGNRSGAFGNDNTIMQDNTFVVGNDVTTTQANSVVLGNASADREATEETGMTLYGQTRQFAGVGSVDQGVVSVGAVGAERQIINVAAGEISAISTDAINGSQLFQTNQALDDFAGDMATYLGGGASHDPNGAVTPPTYTLPDPSNVGGTADYHNVGDALSGLANAGLNFQGDQSGALGFVHRNIGDTLALSGGQSDSNALSRNPNIGVIRNVAGDGYDILLAKDLEGLGNVTVGADGKDGLAGLDGTDGLPGVSLKGEEGAIGMTGMDGTSADITLITGVPGVDGVPGTDGLTRIVYEDVDGNEHTVATHDDGLRFSGNENPGAGYITRTLNKELPIMGGATTAGDYSSANIKTVTTQDGGIEIQMAETPFFQGADMGGEKITNVAPGTDATDAVNLGQLQQSTFNAGQNGPVVYTDADGNKVAKANDGNWYDASVVNPDGSLIGLPTQVTEVIASMQSADGSTIDPTTLANVAAGKASTDAVNVSQLGAALGGDSIDADGNYVGPTYNILGDTYDNVGDAIAASTTHYYSVNSANQTAGSYARKWCMDKNT